MIIYGRSNDHLWTNLEEFGPSTVSYVVIIYGPAGYHDGSDDHQRTADYRQSCSTQSSWSA